MRSIWKGTYTDNIIYKFLFSKSRTFDNKWLKKNIDIRGSNIPRKLVGKYFLIHNGLENILFKIREKHVSLKIGQLIKTRQKPIHDKKKKKKNKWDILLILNFFDFQLLFIGKWYII